MKIPVFHDDQHGTAIIVRRGACSTALKLVGKGIGEVKLVVSGAGAAALACLDLLVRLGLQRENIFVCRHQGRRCTRAASERHGRRTRRATRSDTSARTLADVIAGADMFLGLLGRRRAEARHGQDAWRASR